MTKSNNQIQALKNAAKNKRQSAIEKVKNTLHNMKEKNLPISIGLVAKLAGVLRSWLYNNPDLQEEINQYRHKDGDKIHRIVDLQQMIITRDKKIIFLKSRNQKLKEIVKKLRRQLEVVYGELYKRKDK
jgi:hypothetical protein